MFENRIFTYLDEIYEGGFIIRSYRFTPDGDLVSWDERFEKVQQGDVISYERVEEYGVPVSLEEFKRALELVEGDCKNFIKDIHRTKCMYIDSQKKESGSK